MAVALPTQEWTGVKRKRWTRDELARFEQTNALPAGRYELIEAELIDKMGKNRPHTRVLMRLMSWLLSQFTFEFAQSETSIDVSPEDNPTNHPEPDAILLNKSEAVIGNTDPGPKDLALVAEVSDSTLSFDLGLKASLYARAGIVEYWVVDITSQTLIVHREPIDGAYTWRQSYRGEDSIAPLAAPDKLLTVKTLFPDPA